MDKILETVSSIVGLILGLEQAGVIPMGTLKANLTLKEAELANAAADAAELAKFGKTSGPVVIPKV